MRIPYRWIREFVELALTPAQAADRLVNAGVEVASITRLAPDIRGVVVGVIEAIERELGESQGHRLVLCRVSTGREKFAVVCGAPNVAVGVRAAFAPPGALLPGGPGLPRRIEPVTIRSVVSQGMLCSERELGLGDEHERGLLLLESDALPGADLIEHLGLDDSVLEIEITPNRPDCLCVIGVARELAALTGAPFRPPASALRESEEPVERLARVRLEASELCRRFTARVISGVTVTPSPAWMAARLHAVGLRPISNVVDVTNYVLWEWGHPLHAFDYDSIASEDPTTVTTAHGGRPPATIVVRRARAGERFKTLDGQDRELSDAMLVIADPVRAIGLAGVMGGADSEISSATTRILLESAYFDPASIRRTSRALSLKTDAAYRFERGADIEALVDASARAAQLIADLAGGSVARGIVDAYPEPRPRPRLRLRMERIRRVIGVVPPKADALGILRGLGLPASDTAAGIEVEVPSFRRDIAIEDDLVEEVIRVWGYDRIPATLPGGAMHVVGQPSSFRQERAARQALVGAGLTEVVTSSFSDPALDEALGSNAGGEHVDRLPLLNPLSQDASLMRRHLLEGLLGVVATNVRRQQPDVRIFEIGKTYGRDRRGIRERRWLGIALTGRRFDTAWYVGGDGVDVYDAKGLAEHALAALGLPATRTSTGALVSVFEADCQGMLTLKDGRVVAGFGEVRESIRHRFEIVAPVFAALLPLDDLLELSESAGSAGRRHEPLPRFPSVERDMAFLVGAGQPLTAAEVEAAIAAEAGPLLRRVALFDVFRFPDGRRSLAWHLVFQAPDRTLTDDEVNAIHARITRRVSEQFHISLRGL
jgi:phenylalanyl-tRNA synthetase beta chain